MLTGLLRKNAEARPRATAIVQGKRRITYQELDRAAGRCAGFLRQHGVGSGDTVAAALPNCVEFIIAFFAVMRLRAILLPLNHGYTSDEMQRTLAEGGARVVITDVKRESICRECAGTATVVSVGQEDWAGCEEVPPQEDPFSGRALYLSTSGSTDSYKRICCTQENLHFEAYNFVETTGLSADDAILCTIPLFHSYGLGNCLLDALYTGATLVLEADPEAPFAARSHQVLELLRTESIGFYPGVPYQFEVLAASTMDVRSYF